MREMSVLKYINKLLRNPNARLALRSAFAPAKPSRVVTCYCCLIGTFFSNPLALPNVLELRLCCRLGNTPWSPVPIDLI